MNIEEMAPREPRIEAQANVLQCRTCGRDFIFTPEEQLVFKSRGFVNMPKRCRACRIASQTGRRMVRTDTQVVCAQCKTPTTVPFKPTTGKPVLCRNCFLAKSPATGSTIQASRATS